MIIDVITIFPEMLEGFLNNSIIKRTIDKGLVEVRVHNFRDFSLDKHNKVDDTTYGGGAGMLIALDPIVKCLKNIDGYKEAHKIITNPIGEVYNQKKAYDLSKKEHLIIICGHYEGIDDRIENYIDEEISIGDYVLTGGEIASIAIIDSVIRLLPDSINSLSISDESFSDGLLEYPQFTKPSIYDGYEVPQVLLNGDHAKIEKYRLYESLKRTFLRRKDLLEKREFNDEERYMLDAIKKDLDFDSALDYVKNEKKKAKSLNRTCKKK
jgi:tRNA (guanine37-N1)-methyltransferase